MNNEPDDDVKFLKGLWKYYIAPTYKLVPNIIKFKNFEMNRLSLQSLVVKVDKEYSAKQDIHSSYGNLLVQPLVLINCSVTPT